MSDGGIDPLAEVVGWVREVGRPMKADVDALKRAFWWAAGSAMGAGVVLGLLAPYVLRKLGLT